MPIGAEKINSAAMYKDGGPEQSVEFCQMSPGLAAVGGLKYVRHGALVLRSVWAKFIAFRQVRAVFKHRDSGRAKVNTAFSRTMGYDDAWHDGGSGLYF